MDRRCPQQSSGPGPGRLTCSCSRSGCASRPRPRARARWQVRRHEACQRAPAARECLAPQPACQGRRPT
eukprot:2221546-Prymnesium_polylepis.1